MRILHTEASTGWGGQEIRILREAEGMRIRGHEIFFVIVEGGELANRAQAAGFVTYELPMDRWHAFSSLFSLMKIIRKHRIDIVNTHSSFDAWLGGIAGRLMGRKIIRTRHISTKIRPGLNARILYGSLAHHVVTTCQSTAKTIREIATEKCTSIPTGIDISSISNVEDNFRKKYGIQEDECVVGTACVLRSWKGLETMVNAAKILESVPRLKWLIVGSGSMDNILIEQCRRLGISDKVIFTGFLDNPFPAISSMDIFMLLSSANEGVSQASLQAGYFSKPLITTNIGGLPEVCLDGTTGFTVPVGSPETVAEKVLQLVQDPPMRKKMGQSAYRHVMDNFTMEKTLDEMEKIYSINFKYL